MTCRKSGALIVLILIVALTVRLATIDFGLPAMLDPDELVFLLGSMRMITGGQLNPGWFGHPATTTMYVLALVYLLIFSAGWISGRFTSPEQFAQAIYMDPAIVMLPGRLAIAVFAVICIFLTYRLAVRLSGRPAGAIAAGLLAVSPVHITYSQIIRSDMMATTFMLGALMFALSLARTGRWKYSLMFAVMVALATATKWPYAVTLIAGGGALGYRVWSGMMDIGDAVRRIAAIFLITLCGLAIVSPFLILDYRTVVSNLQGESQAGHLGASGGSGWENASWYVLGPLASALGSVGLLSATAGLFFRRAKAEFYFVIGLTAVALFGLIIFQTLRWERWALPLVPLFAITAGIVLAGAWESARRHVAPRWRALVISAACAALFVPPAIAAYSDSVERSHDTRNLAARWIVANAEPGSSVMVEHFAFELLARADIDIVFPAGMGGCMNVRETLRGGIEYARVDAFRGGHSNLDYGAVPRSKRASCNADYMLLTEYERYAAERDTYPKQFAAYRALISRGTIRARFAPIDGKIGGRSVVVLGTRK